MTKITTEELRQALDDFYTTEQDIADQKKDLVEDMNNYADQIQVDHKAISAAYQAYKKKMKNKETNYLSTAESLELIEIVENMF